MRTPSIGWCLLSALVVSGSALSAQHWPQWRGPSRDGVVDAAIVPAAWPAAATPLWRVEVGDGYASPVVADGRAFVHSRRDPEELVTALDLNTGAVLWQQKYNAPFAKNQYAVRMGKGPNATPVVAAGVVYTLGTTGILSAWRAADGSLLWRNDYSASVDTSKLFCGTAASPLVEQGSVVVQVGSDVHGGRVMMLDARTGAARWTWTGPGPGYASPIAITVAGVRQIVTLTNGSIVGLDVKSGALLWSTDFADEWHENIVSPSWTGTHLIVSGVRQGTQAFTLAAAGGTWRAARAWRNADVTMYMSAPVVADGSVYGFSNKRKGQFVALDAATGVVRWATEGRGGEHASILLAPSHLLLLSNTGDLIVARRSPTAFAEDRRISIGASETWATPALIPGGLVVRDAVAIQRLQWAK